MVILTSQYVQDKTQYSAAAQGGVRYIFMPDILLSSGAPATKL